MRWVEMVVGTLLRQAVLALVLGVLVYGYALIISMAMPWGMQIMFMALLTIAVFFYRRPFQHLFSSMDGHTLTTRMLGDAASAPTLQRAANALPPVAAARVGPVGHAEGGARCCRRRRSPAAPPSPRRPPRSPRAGSGARRRRGDGTPSGARVPAPRDSRRRWAPTRRRAAGARSRVAPG